MRGGAGVVRPWQHLWGGLWHRSCWAGSHQCPPCPHRPFLSYQRMYYVFIYMLSSGPAWLGIVLLVTVGLLPDVLKKVLCRQLWPTATERTQVRSQPSQARHSALSV